VIAPRQRAVAPLKRETLGSPQQPRRPHFSAAGVLIIVLLFFAVTVVAPSFRLYVEQRQQIADLESRVAEQRNDVDAITSKRARWDDPAYIRAQARDRLYYIMPGEVSYLILDDVRPGGQASVPVSEFIEATKIDWVQSLFGSLVVSGLTAKTPEELQPAAGAPAH